MKIRNTLLSGVAALAVLGLSTGLASAADVDFVPEDVFSWSGFYIGAHAGWGGADVQGEWCPSECEVDFDDFDLDGGLGGLHAGFNFDMQSWLLGIEADVSFPAWHGTAHNCGGTCTSSAFAGVDALASLRARLGFTFDRSLIYVTGGVAGIWGDIEGNCSGFCGKTELDDVGGVVGAGFEHAVGDNVSIRAEGLWYFFNGEESLDDWDEANGFEDNDEHDEAGFDDAFVGRVGIQWLIN
jgi:outer membrane immunogenic protein